VEVGVKRDSAQLSALVGLMAAVFIAVVLNVLGARHFRRWDWTRGGLYSLSPATLVTLHDLPDTVEIWVLFGSQDPLLTSVKQLLVSYAAETTKLDIHYVDPDKDAIAFLDVRRRFKIEASRTEDGRVLTDASIVVVRGEKHWFLAPTDLVEVAEADGSRAKPKEEQALTGAIRNVLSGEKARLCFTQNNDEMALGDPGPQGVGVLKDLLEKDNYAVVAVDPNDGTVLEPFKDCAVLVIAGPRTPFSSEAGARIKAYVVTGGNLLAGISPMGAPTETGLERPGLDAPLAMFGIVLDEDIVIEHEATKMLPEQLGGFIATPKTHALTQGLVKSGEGTHEPPRVLIMRPRSMHRSGSGAPPADLLTTSPSASGVTNVTGAAKWPFEGPEKTSADLAGPLTLAMASEGPKEKGQAHGPRAVVFGSASMLQAVNWQEGIPNRGAAFLVENAISWLASKPVVLDVPDKPQVVAAIHLTDDARSELWRYVLLYMPLTAACAGILIGILRAASEGKKKDGSAAARPGRGRQKDVP
jgi:hypothetical protein